MIQGELFSTLMLELTVREVQSLVSSGLLRPVRRTKDGRVTEYELTHAGRVFLGREENQ